MKNRYRPAAVTFALLMAIPSMAATLALATAAEQAPSENEVEQARRCAAETRAAGHAFAEVRDNVRAGGTTRAESLLNDAEDALLAARSACRGNAEVSGLLEALGGEAEALRRALGSSRR